MKRERIVRTENIDRQRINIEYCLVLFSLCAGNGAVFTVGGRQDAGLGKFFF